MNGAVILYVLLSIVVTFLSIFLYSKLYDLEKRYEALTQYVQALRYKLNKIEEDMKLMYFEEEA